MYAWRGVDAAVQQSIEKLDSEEKRKKLLGNVLLVGGGSLVPHLVPILADWCANQRSFFMFEWLTRFIVFVV